MKLPEKNNELEAMNLSFSSVVLLFPFVHIVPLSTNCQSSSLNGSP